MRVQSLTRASKQLGNVTLGNAAGGQKAWIAPGLSRWIGLGRADREINSLKAKLGVQHDPLFRAY